MAQPPGNDTSALPKRATSGPSTRIDARIVFTSSYGATVSLIVGAIDFDARTLIDRDGRAHAREQLDRGGHVLEVRHVADDHRLGGENRARQDGQRGVLRTRDLDLALERHAALDLQLVHQRAASSGVSASIDMAWISRPMSSPSVL